MDFLICSVKAFCISLSYSLFRYSSCIIIFFLFFSCIFSALIHSSFLISLVLDFLHFSFISYFLKFSLFISFLLASFQPPFTIWYCYCFFLNPVLSFFSLPFFNFLHSFICFSLLHFPSLFPYLMVIFFFKVELLSFLFSLLPLIFHLF